MTQAADIDGQHGFEIVVAQRVHRARIGHAGIVDENVDAPEARHGFGYQAFCFRLHGDIRSDGHGPFRAEFCDHLIKVGLFAAVDDDRESVFGKTYRDGAAKASSATGDDGDFVVGHDPVLSVGGWGGQ
nr:hypothetical protein [Tritonibacter mobilis]